MTVASIISALPDAALRSLALAIGVWLILRIFRVRNALALKCAWTLVLAAAFLMPLLLPIASRLPRATLVLPAFMHRAAPVTPAPLPEQSVAPQPSQPIAPAAPQHFTKFAAPAATRPHHDGSPAAVPADFTVPPVKEVPAPPAPAFQALSIFAAAALLYLAISVLLLVRLVYGLMRAFLLWRSARPVSTDLSATHGLRLRASAAVSSPVTIGFSVILPADYMEWDSEKLRIVLAHERSHIRQGDFYLQALAGLYAAIVWFSPLGWWIKRQLSDLAEAISDRSGLEQAASRASYAQILLEFAAAPHLTEFGVAMARSSNLSHRIERLFNEGAFRQAFTASRRTLATALLVPVVLFAAATFVRVTAAAQTQESASASSQSPAQPAAPSNVAPAAPEAVPAPPQTPAPSSVAAPAVPAAPAAPTHVDVPAVHVAVPAVHVKVPAQHIDVPAVHVDVPAVHVDVPAIHVVVPPLNAGSPERPIDIAAKHIDIPARHIDISAKHIDIPAKQIDIPARQIDIPAKHIDIPATHIDVPSSEAPSGSDGRAANGSGGELLAMLNNFGHALFFQASVAEPAAAETTFDRNLTFSGKLDLSVSTGSGNVTFTRGPANQIHIHGIVKVNHDGDPAQAQQIAANPPIEQQGNTIHIGGHQENLHNISISYVIEAPADTALNATTGSGNISDTGVGQDAKLTAGSGNIMATGIEGGFKVQTGSGNVTIDGTGQGDAKAQTGSGTIDLKGVHGGLTAQTGSGTIKAEGTPSSPWRLQTGSGNIELATGNAPIDLDASAGSGSISTKAATTQTSMDKHHLHAQLNGGGPEVRVQTGSGSIRVD
ncbi:MAG: M56 family metallopeptidase [Terracidiphilus sp.]|nr:M56 family metallopeptidase [Terracidiphilus sp.]MDR3796897.1 M56 family metallopeptidase [Terracidiphilus sp.]